MEAGQGAYMRRRSFRRLTWLFLHGARAALFHHHDFFEHLALRRLTRWPFGEGELPLHQRNADGFLRHEQQILELALEAFVEVLGHRVAALTHEHLGEELTGVRRNVGVAIHAG